MFLERTTGENSRPVTERLFNVLGEHRLKKLRANLLAAGRPELIPSDENWKRQALSLWPFFGGEDIPELPLLRAMPPDDVHSMVRSQEFFAGDFYHCDAIVESLGNGRLAIEPGEAYLDFGCSSGRIVRNMRAAYLRSHWYGCDPQPNSIKWANANIPGVTFFVSPLAPPMNIESAAFAGVFAISIWSHFGREAALKWFAEMKRIVRPGGWLFFSAAGPNAVRHMQRQGLWNAEKAADILWDLDASGFHYEDVFGERGDWGIPNNDWGLAYLTPSWIASELIGKDWALRDFKPGRISDDQDIYLLERLPD